MKDLKLQRVASIDVFRALTMFLMIFVNDLWSVQGIPEWLEHVSAQEDGLGLADVVFPMFLFIVGLSIPFAVNNRVAKGDSDATILKHVLLRSLAMIVMGVFHVNLESYSEAALLPRLLWEILITISFFLIWLDYPKTMQANKKYFLQGLGLVLLSAMAIVYRGGTVENPEWMTTQWWGILGLIGWSYLIVSLLYVLFKQELAIHLLLFFVFLSLSAADKFNWLDGFGHLHFIVDGSLHALVMGGVVVSCFYIQSLKTLNVKFFGSLITSAILLIAFCFITRPLWGIHKIGATPSWVTLCLGISILVFVFLIWLIDMKQKEKWFAFLKPAGTSTLTAYLIPYLTIWISAVLPMFLRIGVIGLFTCLVYALITIFLTGFLEKRRIRLKI
jgi:predicted acyltransferase